MSSVGWSRRDCWFAHGYLMMSGVVIEMFCSLAHVADLLRERRADGFLDVAGAAEYLSTTRKSVYHLVECGRLPHHRAGGRLLFDRSELRAWVERGG